MSLFPDHSFRFAARLCAAIALSVLLWTQISEGWAVGFRIVGNLEAAAAVGRGRIRLVPGRAANLLQPSDQPPETVIWVLGQGSMPDFRLPTHSWGLSYVPLMMFASLTFSSRAWQWRASARGIVLGSACIVAFALLAVGLTINRAALLAPSAEGKSNIAFYLNLLRQTLIMPPGFDYGVPAFIWFAGVVLWPAKESAGREELPATVHMSKNKRHRRAK